MDAIECILKRRSVRAYKRISIPEKYITTILKCAESAPSAGGLKSQKIVVVKDEKTKLSLAKASLNQMFIAEAPVVFVVLVNEEKVVSYYGERGKFYAICDGSAATENILLAATALNLSSCWIGAFNDEKVKQIINTTLKPIAIIPVGYGKV